MQIRRRQSPQLYPLKGGLTTTKSTITKVLKSFTNIQISQPQLQCSLLVIPKSFFGIRVAKPHSSKIRTESYNDVQNLKLDGYLFVYGDLLPQQRSWMLSPLARTDPLIAKINVNTSPLPTAQVLEQVDQFSDTHLKAEELSCWPSIKQ